MSVTGPATLTVVSSPMIDQEHVYVQVDSEFTTSVGTNMIKYMKVPIRLPVGQKVLIPRAAANLWFGNPELLDDPTDRNNRPRTAEFVRLIGKWGGSAAHPETAQFPKVRMWDFDTDSEVHPIIVDPTGSKTAAEPEPSNHEDIKALAAQTERKLREIQALASQMGIPLGVETEAAPQPVQFEAPPDAPDASTDYEQPTSPPAPELDDMPAPADPTATAKRSPSKRKPSTAK